jgi:hypothetical protein
MKHKDLRIAIMMRNNLHREGKNFWKWLTNTVNQMQWNQKLLSEKAIN